MQTRFGFIVCIHNHEEVVPHTPPWRESWKNNDGTISNLRLDSSSKALEAYRKEIASPFFVTKVEIAHK